MPYVKRHSGFVQDVADIPDMVCLAIPTIAADFLGISQVTLGRNGNAEALGRGHTLEKTAVPA